MWAFRAVTRALTVYLTVYLVGAVEACESAAVGETALGNPGVFLNTW